MFRLGDHNFTLPSPKLLELVSLQTRDIVAPENVSRRPIGDGPAVWHSGQSLYVD